MAHFVDDGLSDDILDSLALSSLLRVNALRKNQQ